jgi:hypothetical protein
MLQLPKTNENSQNEKVDENLGGYNTVNINNKK